MDVMVEDWIGFAAAVGQLSTNVVAMTVALGLALLIRGRTHALVAVADLWLFMELLTTLLDPDYRFAELLGPRLLASGIQVAAACGVIRLWRYWRMATASVAAE